MGFEARIDDVCGRRLPERELRIAVLAELRSIVPFDAYAWLSTDPVTCVGSSPVAEVPELADLPQVIGAKYRSSINRWTSLVPGEALSLASAAEEDLARSPFWRTVAGRYGIADVVSVVVADGFGCWGFLDLWRRAGVFEPSECALVGEMAMRVTPAVRGALLSTFEQPIADLVEAPAVLLLSDELAIVGQTDGTEAVLAALLPDGGPTAVPAAAFNAAAQLLAVEAGVDDRPPQARVHLRAGAWLTVRAGRINAAGRGGVTIAVTIEPTTPAERTELYGRVAGLTAREAEVLGVVAAGHDTRHAARALAISEHTLQDHLKSIFTKTRTDSRRLLVARATGAGAGAGAFPPAPYPRGLQPSG